MTVKVGETVRISASLLVGNVLTDPNTLRLDITDPASTVTSYVWGVDPELVRDGVGQFHFDLFVTQPGTWKHEWFSNASLTAFTEGTIVTAQTFALQVVDDSTTPAPIPFADIVVTDSNTNVLHELTADANGEASVLLDPGHYRFSARKLGWRIPVVTADLVASGGGPAADVVMQGYELTEGWLKVRDLETVVSKETIDRLFHDDNSGDRDADLLQSIIDEAEALAESKLLRSWSREQVARLAWHDRAVRTQAAWIAIELATERRSEFVSSDGKGRFYTQYERAIAFFDNLSKSKDHSRGEKAQRKLGVSAGGVNGNTGGNRKPPSQQNNWTFADEADGTKHGGF